MSSDRPTKKIRSALEDIDDSGAFKRTESKFREFISVDHPEFTPDANRYHLYISYACPWANGTLCMLRLKGLEKFIGVSITHYSWQRTRPDDPNDTHAGWVFRSPTDAPIVPMSGQGSMPCDGCIPDPLNNAASIRDLYDLSNDTNGKYTVPVLWDKKTNCIVNNESQEILRMFNSSFNHLLPEGSKERELDLYPAHLVADIDAANEWIYDKINNGVYRCGFAKTQGAYNSAVAELYDALDRVEQILATNRYICGSQLTGMDLRLFMTLIRYDEVYVVYFKCNKRPISSYVNTTNYMRELYQHPVIGSVIRMDHIKGHYFTSHTNLNCYSIIPAGPGVLEDMQLPHDRNRFQK
eukprot:CAMPEP_0185030586 /NCGR_PEP_ID=MMETSP1103-20130426/17563_1 /TAXON_ID=36769 /ORGANISM="Paraphysomonas bandaiensis, Strain Caron Lab Isolate" /LENGTH=352 /DNA_ID=CAMNT_0027565777 /DNA_START=27 /DNA_END=1085 /DNA_ORIENTATION=-